MAEHLSATDAAAAGLRALPGSGNAFSSTQAAWRFFANADVTAAALAAPLHDCARAMAAELDRVALVVVDWSPLSYAAHTRKTDRIRLSHATLGYELQTALLLSDRNGMALSLLAASLWTSDRLYTTRGEHPGGCVAHLDELTKAMEEIEALGIGTRQVYIIDREGDSVAHLRQWDAAGRWFVVRADAAPRAVFEGTTMPLGEVASRLSFLPAGAVEIAPGVIGQQVVAEAQVTLTRPANPHRQRGGVKQARPQIAGRPLPLRLIVSEVRTPDEVVHARWLLVTNVEASVGSEQIAQWYVWRWRTESFYKLLKRAGMHAEQWGQEGGEAIFKRLLVSAMAAVVVWQVARASGAEAEATRALLVRLSGRQMRRERPHTEPALLAGLWVLLAMLDALEHYSLPELKRIARLATMGLVPDDSS